MSLEAKLKERNGADLDDMEDVENLNLDKLVTISKISDNDKKYLEKFRNAITLTATGIGLTSVENFPKLPSLKIVCLFLTYLANS